MHHFTRDARHRAKPRKQVASLTPHHFGDEFDLLVPEDGVLTIVPERDYVPVVTQTFDEFTEGIVSQSVPNQLGPVFEDAEPLVTEGKSFASYIAAFAKRSNAQPDEDDDCTPFFQQAFMDTWADIKPFAEWDVDESDVERWLSKFDPCKRIRMVKALDELFDCEDDSAYLGTKTLSVKVEALLKRYDNQWCPRLIYAGNDHFNALTGPVAMILMEKLKTLCETKPIGGLDVRLGYKTDSTVLAKHLADARDVGYNHCAEADFSANDLRQRKFATKGCDHVYGILGCPKWARKLFVDMRKFHVRNLEHGHQADLANQLPTGTTLTTPRNCIWNISIEATYCRVNGIKGRALCLGDDWLSMLSRSLNIRDWEDWVDKETRMKLTAAQPALQGGATFLSRRLFVDRPHPIMMPKLGKALARFNARASPNTAISDNSYMAGKALCYAYEFRFVPLLRDLFLMRFNAEGSANVDYKDISYYTRSTGVDSADALLLSMTHVEHELSEDETREFMMDCYGDSFGLVDCLEISERIILCTDLSSVPFNQELTVDF